MVQIVVWAAADQEGGYERGEILDVLPDGVSLGRLVDGGVAGAPCIEPKLVILDVPGVTKAQLRAALNVQFELIAEYRDRVPYREIFKLVADNLTAAIRRDLRDNRRATITASQARGIVARLAKSAGAWWEQYLEANQ